jgi:hypothetical protein
MELCDQTEATDAHVAVIASLNAPGDAQKGTGARSLANGTNDPRFPCHLGSLPFPWLSSNAVVLGSRHRLSLVLIWHWFTPSPYHVEPFPAKASRKTRELSLAVIAP